MEISKIQIFTILAIIVIFVLLFPIPMSRSREEVSTTQKSMEWQVTWKIITIDKQWGPDVGTQTFTSSTFLYDWGYGNVYGNYDDGIGFFAEASFYQENDGLYRFNAGSDDGIQLYIDGTLLIDVWRDQPYRESSVELMIGPGWHTLRIDYYEWRNAAKVYFNVDKGDLFAWEEAEVETVTETVYVSILEYLMKGGTA